MTTMMMGRQDDSLIKIIKLPRTTRHTKGFGGDAIYTKTGVVLPSPIPKSDHSLAKQSANPYEMNSTLNCFPSSHPFARIMMTVYLAEEDSPLSHHFSLSLLRGLISPQISPPSACVFCFVLSPRWSSWILCVPRRPILLLTHGVLYSTTPPPDGCRRYLGARIISVDPHWRLRCLFLAAEESESSRTPELLLAFVTDAQCRGLPRSLVRLDSVCMSGCWRIVDSKSFY